MNQSKISAIFLCISMILTSVSAFALATPTPVSYTHLTLPTN